MLVVWIPVRIPDNQYIKFFLVTHIAAQGLLESPANQYMQFCLINCLAALGIQYTVSSDKEYGLYPPHFRQIVALINTALRLHFSNTRACLCHF